MKKVVVVIVTWNGMKWIKTCLDSLRASTYQVCTIVIDNGSSDNTVPFIKSNYPEVILVQSKCNLGFGQANNIGFRYAIEQNADYVYLLNQDAYVYPDMFEKLLEVADNMENNKYAIFSPLHVHGDKTSLDSQFKEYLTSISASMVEDLSLSQIKKIYPVDCVPAAGWLLPIKTLNTIGGFDPIFFHYGEDHHYAQRVKYHGFQIGIVPQAKMIHDRDGFGNPEVANRNAISRSIKTDILLNINLSKKQIARKMMKLFFIFSYESVCSLFHGNFILPKNYCLSYFEAFGHFREYSKNRAKNRTKGRLWL